LSFIMAVPSEQPEAPASSLATKAPQATSESLALSSALTLRHRLAAEINNLRAHAVDWQGGRRKVRFWTKVIVRIVKGML
jgi:CDP-diacylglycerol--glycerol-3-phosphate 3-phosphatidyltransferase